MGGARCGCVAMIAVWWHAICGFWPKAPKRGSGLTLVDRVLRGLNGYMENNDTSLPNYGALFRAGKRIATSFVESAINQLVDKRMSKSQQMRSSDRGAHLLLQVRAKVVDDRLADKFEQWYPGFQAEGPSRWRHNSPESIRSHRDGLRKAMVTDHGPVGDALFERIRRETRSLTCKPRGPVGREIVDALRGYCVDPLAYTGARGREQVEHETGIDAGAEHCDSEGLSHRSERSFCARARHPPLAKSR